MPQVQDMINYTCICIYVYMLLR